MSKTLCAGAKAQHLPSLLPDRLGQALDEFQTLFEPAHVAQVVQLFVYLSLGLVHIEGTFKISLG